MPRLVALPAPVRAALLRQPRLRGLALRAAEVGLRYGPGRVRNDLGRPLYLDSADNQAQRLALRRGLLDRPAIALWRRVVAGLRPTVVLDVGCNYGEVVLAGEYPADCRIHCIEPNPVVAGYLARSLRASLPTARLLVAAAGEASGELFLVPDPASSGLGYTSRSGGPGAGWVPAVACDDVVQVTAVDRLAFKLDVEGSEVTVLEGLTRSLAGAAAACGVLEFYLLSGEQQRKLVRRHSLYAAADDGSALYRLGESDLDAFFPCQGSVRPGFAKDVVLTTGDATEMLLTGGAGFRIQ
jgi:FkbM family methyltransferase